MELMEALPNELVLEICGYLTLPDLLRLSETAWRYRNIVDGKFLHELLRRWPGSKPKRIVFGLGYYALFSAGREASWRQVFLRRLRVEQCEGSGGVLVERAQQQSRCDLWLTVADFNEQIVSRDGPGTADALVQWSTALFELSRIHHRLGGSSIEALETMHKIAADLLQRSIACDQSKFCAWIELGRQLSSVGSSTVSSLKQASDVLAWAQGLAAGPKELFHVLALRGICLAQLANERALLSEEEANDADASAEESLLAALAQGYSSKQVVCTLANLLVQRAAWVSKLQGPEVLFWCDSLFSKAKELLSTARYMVIGTANQAAMQLDLTHEIGQLLVKQAEIHAASTAEGTAADTAEKYLRQALAIFETIPEAWGIVPFWKGSHAVACVHHVRLLLKRGAAREAHDQAAHARALLSHPSIPSGLRAYNLARLASLFSEDWRCKQLLAECVTSISAEKLAADPSFDTVRGSPWFSELLMQCTC